MTKRKDTTVTKADLAAAVHERLQVNKRDAELAVDTVFAAMLDALADEKELKLAGFGRFFTRRWGPRFARNPKTKEAMQLPPRTVVAFRASSKLSGAVQGEKNGPLK